MNLLEYQTKLNNIITMAPVESGVQTLVYQLLEDLINSKENILLDVDSFNTDSMFASVFEDINRGAPDLAIVSPEFIYVPSIWKKNISNGRRSRYKMHEVNNIVNLKEMDIDEVVHINLLKDMREKMLGCVEAKATNINLPIKIEQLACHIFQYKKVIYTNGLVWVYFEKETSEFGKLKKLIRDNLKTMISKSEKDIKSAKLDEMGIKWIIPLVYNDDGKVCPAKLEREKIEINEEKFSELLEKLRNIEWEKNSYYKF